MQPETQTFLDRTDRLAAELRCSLDELAEKLGISRATLFAGRKEGPVSSKTWRRVEQAEREIFGNESDFSDHKDRIAEAARGAASAEELDARLARLERMIAGPRATLGAALQRRGWTPAELAKRIGYDPGVIENVVRGLGRASESMIDKIITVLTELTKAELMGGSDSPQVIGDLHGSYGAKPTIVLPPGMTGRMVPMLSLAQAGSWDAGHTDEGWAGEAVFALNVDDRRAFAIQVNGNSMEPELHDGDMVICSPGKPPTPGCVAVVRTTKGEAFVKYWFPKREMIHLESAHPDYKTLKFPVAEIAGAWPVVQRTSSGMIQKQKP